jgi:hypothetical protein
MTIVAPLLHIGLHKTGTNWLQRHVFTSAAVGFVTAANEKKIKGQLVTPHDLDFDPVRCRAVYAKWIAKAGAMGRVPVLSAESLSGDMLYGAFDSARLAERLASVFPEGKVLIVIREQRHMLFSSYHQYVKSGGPLALGEYLRQPHPRNSHPWTFVFAQFEYDRLISRYHDLFAEENVLVLPHELFRRDPAGFVRRVTDFAGTTCEPGAIDVLPFGEVVNRQFWPSGAVGARVRANRFLRGTLNRWSPIDGKRGVGRRLNEAMLAGAQRIPSRLNERAEQRMRATIARAIGDHYRASNARTVALTGLDLAAFGYDVKPKPHGEAGEEQPLSSPDRALERAEQAR